MDARPLGRASRVVIYSSRPDANKTLHDLLTEQPDIAAVDVVTGAEHALRAVREGADALLIDTAGLMDPHVAELLEALAHMGNATPVLLLGVPPVAVEIARAIATGPVGAVRSSLPLVPLIRAVQRVVLGAPAPTEEIVAPQLNRLISERRQQQADAEALAALTNRELTVLRLLSEGRRRGEIAEALGVSPNTVRTHLANLMHKLGTHSQLNAAMRGRQLLGIERPAVITLPERARSAQRPAR